jgi:hypothetical protein
MSSGCTARRSGGQHALVMAVDNEPACCRWRANRHRVDDDTTRHSAHRSLWTKSHPVRARTARHERELVGLLRVTELRSRALARPVNGRDQALVISSGGAFGALPWFDRKRRYTAYLSMLVFNNGVGVAGRARTDLLQLIEQALSEAP